MDDNHAMKHVETTLGLPPYRHQARSGGVSIARQVVIMLLTGAAMAFLCWIAVAYLHPDLRKSILFSGFGLC